MIFEWDDQKAASNFKKHGVSFQEAKTVFGDTISITVADPEHSESEYRFIDIGLTERGRLLVVSYIERGTRIRIISSRLPLPTERALYEKG